MWHFNIGAYAYCGVLKRFYGSRVIESGTGEALLWSNIGRLFLKERIMKHIKSKLIQTCVLLLILGTANAASETGNQAVTYPPNDLCADATEIGDVTNLPFNTSGARFGGRGLCMVGPNIWYCYTAPCTGDVTVSLAGSSYDTMLAVYRGWECYPTQTDLIVCNDDFGEAYQSQATFAATAGEQYLIEVGGYRGDAGRGLITIKCEGDVEPPVYKDTCMNARPIGEVTALPFDTTNATFDGWGLCMSSPNIWFCYTAACTGDVTVSLAGSAYDTKLAVYDGCECYPTANDLIECNDDTTSSYQSEVTFAAIAGNQYLIEIGGYASQTGQGVLTIECEGAVVQEKPDLGDAPDRTNNSGRNMRAYVSPWVGARYPTVFDDGSGLGPFGPVHLNNQLVAHLGQGITAETEADIGPDEDGINNINSGANSPDLDEGDDGVAMPLNLPNCKWATIDYEVTVIEPGTDLWVNVWLDFNRDGDWDDTVDCPVGPVREWAVQNQYLFNLPEGQTTITAPAFLSAHPEGTHEQIWMRITLSEQPWRGGSSPGERGNAGSGPQAKYEIGETEDYFFIPDKTGDEGCSLCKDENDDGIIDIQDLIIHITQWLSICQ